MKVDELFYIVVLIVAIITMAMCGLIIANKDRLLIKANYIANMQCEKIMSSSVDCIRDEGWFKRKNEGDILEDVDGVVTYIDYVGGINIFIEEE